MICRIVAPIVTALRLRGVLMAGYRPSGKNRLKPYDDRGERQSLPSPMKMKSMAVYEDESQLQLAESIKHLSLKDFSVKVHHLLVGRQKSPIFWATVEQQFMERLQPTTDPQQIRSYSKVLYALSKSKKATGNYQTKLSLLLPFATPQSFTAIATSTSRIAPYSQQFGYIIEMLYYKRKAELNPREIIAVNYSLANNGRKCDKTIIEGLDSFNAVETITMLRCYDKSQQMTKEVLEKTLKKLLALRNELNALDISDIICIYLKHEYIPPALESMIQQSYSILKRYINDICIEKIWTHLPVSLNKGYLKVKFVQEIITTIEILRKGKNMSEVIWKKIQPSFQQVVNIELRLRLEKIY